MSSVRVRKFQRLTVPAKPLPLEVPVTSTFNVSKQLNANVLTYGELFAFSKTEFPQTTASFNASFSEVTRFWFGYTVSFLAPVVT